MKRLVSALLAGIALCLPGAVGAAAAPVPHKVSPGDALGTARVEITRGHIDLGPRIIDGEWAMLARDDTVSPPMWRHLSDVTMRVTDHARLSVPDDPGYAFLPKGKQVHVVPQTQDPAVVWVGWSTQDPAVVDQLDRGAWLSLQTVHGPGRVTTFVANGFDPPSVLWDSAKGPGQRFWVNTNTHTHINWVFEEPGDYYLTVTVAAKTKAGTDIEAPARLHFLVGDAAAPGPTPSAAVPPAPQATVTEVATTPSTRGWWWLIGGAGVLLATVLVARFVGARRSAGAGIR